MLTLNEMDFLKKENVRCYLEYLKDSKISLGNHLCGEIEIVTDPKIIFEIEEKAKSLLIDEKQPNKWGETGLVYEDQYIVIIRDPVIFPSEMYGTYIRIVPKIKVNNYNGVAIVPLLNGKVILQKNFRHATRNWEIEIPRGFIEESNSPIDAAKKELKEEMGYITKIIIPIGEIKPDSGILSSKIKIYLAYVQEKKEAKQHEFSEAISDKLYLKSVEEVDLMLKENQIKDAITISAIYFAKIKGYL